MPRFPFLTSLLTATGFFLCLPILSGNVALADDKEVEEVELEPDVAEETSVPQTITVEGIDGELPLVFSEDFEDGNADGWTPTDKKAWRMAKDKSQAYHLFVRRSDYKPPVRSPFNRSLIDDLTAGTFVLDLKFKSTSPDYDHRSLCLFFNYVDETHFYYVHFGKKADPHANQIFIVNEKPRTKISETTTPGTPWDDQWHHARIVRNVETGTIHVYFDDMDKPAMTATDKTFTTGQIGIGSFDDPGMFDDIRVYAPKPAAGE